MRLRLPYGKRTGVNVVDRLNIVAHDKFQEIVDEAKKPGSVIRVQQVVLDDEQLGERTVTVVSQPQLVSQLGIQPAQTTTSTMVPPSSAAVAFTSPVELQAVQLAYEAICELEREPETVPSVAALAQPQTQTRLAELVAGQLRPVQRELPGTEAEIDIAAVVEKTTKLVIQKTIDIPRILVVPTGDVRHGFRSFTLKLGSLNFPPPSDELWIQYMRTEQVELLSLGGGGIEEQRLEDYIVSGLVDYDDISYDDHADFLYELAAQVVNHFRGYLSEDDARKVLRYHQKSIAQFVHAQMQEHYWEEATGYEVKVSRGFTALKDCAFTASADNPIRDFRQAPPDKKNIAKYVFGGFERCLYPAMKFQSDPERRLAIILDRDAEKWFKPAKGQFQLYYQWNGEHPEYQPDFVAETDSAIYMLEPKAVGALQDAEVLAKRDVAVRWCKQASEYASGYSGKPWQYVLIPHDAISENMTLAGLAKRYGVNA